MYVRMYSVYVHSLVKGSFQFPIPPNDSCLLHTFNTLHIYVHYFHLKETPRNKDEAENLQ